MIRANNCSACYYRFPYCIPEFPRRVRLWFRGHYHRARYGVAPQDCWSLDHYLALVVANGLNQLADNGISYPGGEGWTPESWNAELRRVAGQFEKLADFDYVHGMTDVPIETARAVKDESFEWLREHFHRLWD